MTVLKEKIIKKTRKAHICNSCEWLTSTDALTLIKSGEIKLSITEKRSVIKAKQTNWKIPVGSSCLYQVGVFDGDFYTCHCIPEIHAICIKYEIYQDY